MAGFLVVLVVPVAASVEVIALCRRSMDGHARLVATQALAAGAGLLARAAAVRAAS